MKGVHKTFDPKCRALYFVNDPKFIRHNDDTLKFDLISQIDLRCLCSAMMVDGAHHGTNVYEQRAQLVTSSYAISRGGKLKFLRFSNIVHDQLFNVTDTGWTEVKNAKKYSMPMVNCMHHDSPEIDFYHSMGCYAMMENGFVSKKEVSQDFVFPSLHAICDQQVAANLTKMIRKYLPKRVTKAIKTSFSSKSQRKAGVTLLSADPNMRFPQIHARTGHSSGSHMDLYLENVGLAFSLPACLSMNGYKNLYQDVYPPTFACLGIAHQSMAKKLIFHLFPVSSEDLKEDGRLYLFTIVMGTTLVMYHNFMRRVYKPTDPVVSRVEEVARSI
jgi:hypothetical protein